MTRKQKLLILNGSISEITLIQAAKRLDFRVVSSGNAPSLPGHAYADEYIPADYSNKEEILRIARDEGIDAIVSCANDFGVITAAYVAEKLGLPGHDTYENALLLHHKDSFKSFIQQLGIRCPQSLVFDSEDAALEYAGTAEYPLMVKATDLTGGKGVSRANTYDDAVTAIEDALQRSRVDKLVIEPYISGIQQSIDTFVIDGKVVASVSNDCYMPINPYLIQSETLPARGIESIEGELHGYIEQICRELDLADGMFTLQYIVQDGKPYIIEMMRRALGNQFLTVARASNGFPWEEALVRAESGMPLDALEWGAPLAPFVGHHGIMSPRNGVFRGYTIDEKLESHVFKTIDAMQPGDEVTNYMEQRVAYVYYAFDSREELESMAPHLNELAAAIVDER